MRSARDPSPRFKSPGAVCEAGSDQGIHKTLRTPLEELHETIDNCRKCESCIPDLCKPVRMFRGFPGSVMIVGQGPGKKERSTGYAFAGQSGKRLDEWLWQCRRRGAARDGIYLTSVMKCVKRSEKELEIMARNCRPIWISKSPLFALA